MLIWNFSDQKLLAKAKSGTQLICVHSYKRISVSYQNLTEYDKVSNFLFSNSGDSELVRKQKIFLEDNHKHLNLREKKNSLWERTGAIRKMAVTTHEAPPESDMGRGKH